MSTRVLAVQQGVLPIKSPRKINPSKLQQKTLDEELVKYDLGLPAESPRTSSMGQGSTTITQRPSTEQTNGIVQSTQNSSNKDKKENNTPAAAATRTPRRDENKESTAPAAATRTPRSVKTLKGTNDEGGLVDHARVKRKKTRVEGDLVDCGYDCWEEAEMLLEYSEDRFNAEDQERIDTINVDSSYGVCRWELSIPNTRLVSRPRRSKASAPIPEETPHASENPDFKGKEYDFVDAPAWKICVDPSNYSYVPNNGRYRASKLAKRIGTEQKYSNYRPRFQYDNRESRDSVKVAPERHHLQREIHRELHYEFEMYLQQEREISCRHAVSGGSDNASASGGSVTQRDSEDDNAGDTELNTYRVGRDTTDYSGESDQERFEAKQWGKDKENLNHVKYREGSVAVIIEPSSVLKVSTGRKKGGRRGKAKILPPLEPPGNAASGDQFLQEVSSKLLKWEYERKGVIMNTVATDSDRSEKTPRELRSKSEPPTITELVDRHQSRTAGCQVDVSDIPSLMIHDPTSNYGTVALSVLGSNHPGSQEATRYRLPKQKTEGLSMRDHLVHHQQRHGFNSSAPMERLSGGGGRGGLNLKGGAAGGVSNLNRPGSTSTTNPPLAMKLPPRGESLPLRHPAKQILQSPIHGPRTLEKVSDTTFSVRRIAGTGNVSASPGETGDRDMEGEITDGGQRPHEGDFEQQGWNDNDWDCDDQAIDAVLRHQYLQQTGHSSTELEPYQVKPALRVEENQKTKRQTQVHLHFSQRQPPPQYQGTTHNQPVPQESSNTNTLMTTSIQQVNNRPVTRTNPTIQASRVLTTADPSNSSDPLQAISVVNHAKFAAQEIGTVPKLSNKDNYYNSNSSSNRKHEASPELDYLSNLSHLQQVPETEPKHHYSSMLGQPPQSNSYNSNEVIGTGSDVMRTGSDVARTGSDPQMVITATKLSNLASKPHKSRAIAKGRSSLLNTDKSKNKTRQLEDALSVELDDMNIGVSGKKIGFNETTQRII